MLSRHELGGGRQWGAVKLIKPYKGNQFLSNYSITICTILMILLADPDGKVCGRNANQTKCQLKVSILCKLVSSIMIDHCLSDDYFTKL